MATNAIASPTQEAADRSGAHTARSVSAEERQRLVRQAAYYRYVRRNFADGHALDDWLAAEAEVDGRLEQSTEIEELARAAT